MGSVRNSWALRALVAGFVGSLVGAGVCTANYLTLPGALRIDWSLMAPLVLAFAGLCGTLGGLGIGAGMVFAIRGDPNRAGVKRLVTGSIAGALVGGIAPAVVGIAGFSSVSAPYAGTGNLMGCIWLGVSVFAALWSPALDGRRDRSLLWRLATSAVASGLVGAALAGLGVGLAITFHVVPDFDVLAGWADHLGLVPLGVVIGSVLLVAVGVFMGLACWMHITLMLAAERLIQRRG